MHQCLANVGPCQHANIGMLSIALTTPNVGPAVDCYMGITLKRRRQHCIWRAVKFLTMLITFEQGGIFIVPHLLWHGTSVLQSHLKDRNDNNKRCFLTQIPTEYPTDGPCWGLNHAIYTIPDFIFYMCLVYFYSVLSNQVRGCSARVWPLGYW